MEVTNSHILEALLDCRELFLKGFARFDRAFDEIDRRFDALDRRFDAFDRRFDSLHRRFDGLDRRFDRIERNDAWDACLARFDSRIERLRKGLHD